MNISETNRNVNSIFLPKSDIITILFLTIISLFINLIPYNYILSVILQVFTSLLILYMFRSRPVMMIAGYILLSVLPIRIFGGFYLEESQNHYALNPRMAIFMLLGFYLYNILFVKRKIRFSFFVPIILVIILISYLFAISRNSYTDEFLLIVIAYIILPTFINCEKDIKLILLTFIIAITAFCIYVLPILLQGNLNRGIVNLNPNYASFFVITGVLSNMITYSKYNNISIKFKFFLLISFILSVLTITFFASRSSLLIFIFVIILFIFFHFRDYKKILMMGIIIILLFLFIDKQGYMEGFYFRLNEKDVLTGGGRLSIQVELIKSFLNFEPLRILFGYGHLTADNFGLGTQAHNAYISILIGYGIIGLILYFLYLFNILNKLLKRRNKVFLIAFFVLLLYGLSLEPYIIQEGMVLFCLISGVIRIKVLN